VTELITTMNIFLLHLDPKTCSRYHCDKHVIKMILESTQMLCSVHHIVGSEYTPCYKLTHANHPCSVWVRESLANYVWLCMLAKELCIEYTYRYGKIHKCEAYVDDLTANLPPIEDVGMTAQAMDDIYKSLDPVDAYRCYYNVAKYHMHSWTGKVNGRDKPDWICE
jgi:hypothetical protein